jgi:hypothetical protein
MPDIYYRASIFSAPSCPTVVIGNPFFVISSYPQVVSVNPSSFPQPLKTGQNRKEKNHFQSNPIPATG